MKSKLEELSQKTRKLIGKYATETVPGPNHDTNIARLASTLTRLQQLQRQLAEIEAELPPIEEALAQHGNNGVPASLPQRATIPQSPQPTTSFQTGARKGERKIIRIEIDWSRIGKAKGKEIIFEHLASNSITKWSMRLYEEMGMEVLDRLAGFKINRGPLVSKHPRRDYVKPDGNPYQHQEIPSSGYSILTNTTTQEKVVDIRNACRFLGLPTGMVTVQEVGKHEFARTLVA